MWQTIKQKLSSRKLWVAIGGILAVWLSPDTTGQAQAGLTAVIAAAYALAEGIADAGRQS